MSHFAGLVMRCSGMAIVLAMLSGCGQRTVRIDIVPADSRLGQQTLPGGDSWTSNKVAVVQVSGMIANARSSGLLGRGTNTVSDFRETLDAIASDPHIKAVVLRINSPGGTVTASDMMYRDLLAFREKTKVPVVTSMMDVCASGGYYLSCASDYRMAYPTTITGSIGVIFHAVNFHETLRKIGVTTEAVKSGVNKDMGSQFKPAEAADKPLAASDRELLQKMINDYYGSFLDIVKKSPNKVADKDWAMLTDGRVVTGADAAKFGLIDETGDLDAGIAKAKSLAGIKKAKLVTFSRVGDFKGSTYAQSPVGATQINMVKIDANLGDALNAMQPQFLYMWTGFDLED